MCQDWGGLTGLSVVKDAPDRFSNLVIMNTGLPSPIFDFRKEENGKQDLSLGQTIVGVKMISNQKLNEPLKLFIKLLPFCVWKLFNLLMGTHLPVRKLFEFMYANSVEKEVLDAYGAPFPSRLFKAGTAK